MELKQRFKTVSSVPHINCKIGVLPGASLLQTTNTNCSSEQIIEHVKKSEETGRNVIVGQISAGIYNNIRTSEEDKSESSNSGQLFEESPSRSPRGRGSSSRGRRGRAGTSTSRGRSRSRSGSRGRARGRGRSRQREAESTVDVLTERDEKIKHSKLPVCYEKQTLVEENNSLNSCTRVAAIRNDEVKSNVFQEDKVLDSIDLNRLLCEKGVTSSELKKECRKICFIIKNTSENIAHVEAAYRKEDDKKVIFLVFAETEIQNQSRWETEIRIMNKYSDESRSLLHCKENYPLTENESRKIGEIIDKHSKNLMSKHKFLSVISASNVVSKHFGTKQHDKVTRPCIVLTVPVKGIIPLFEKPFPTELKGITVDVREGGFRFCKQNADEYQTNLRIGCKISSSTCPGKFGSLGGFIEHPQHGLCGITCAHVVLNDNDKYKLSKSRTGTFEDSFNLGTIYQPVNRAGNEIGKIVKIVYKEGNESTHGVDLALFKIEKRAPIDGGFPDSQLTSFDAGLVWTKAGIPSDHNRVQKFGCVSGNTTGFIQFDNTVTREIRFDSLMTPDGEGNLRTSLFKQYLIKTLHEDIRFCGVGDSGSLVLMKDDTGEDLDLRCIGMVVGLLDDESCVVTPIAPILHELKVYQLKQFTPNILKRISDKLDTVHDTFDRRFGELDNLVRGRQWCSIM